MPGFQETEFILLDQRADKCGFFILKTYLPVSGLVLFFVIGRLRHQWRTMHVCGAVASRCRTVAKRVRDIGTAAAAAQWRSDALLVCGDGRNLRMLLRKLRLLYALVLVALLGCCGFAMLAA
ncbi:hypothetical protein GO998_22135 (plasmid) [Ralstonia syzygii]|uniref:Transmembrane protein n=1 Tax=Ralstonia syzygii TaxID=28097 RepID=A0ABX7ZLP0_9RALS|nr:hypothetical protein GO998_22135 [Ralstonia syzygii]